MSTKIITLYGPRRENERRPIIAVVSGNYDLDAAEVVAANYVESPWVPASSASIYELGGTQVLSWVQFKADEIVVTRQQFVATPADGDGTFQGVWIDREPLEQKCNTLFCVADKHADDLHVDATGHSWNEALSDTPVAAHVIEVR